MADRYSDGESERSPFARERVVGEQPQTESSIATLLSGLVVDAQTLVHREIDLAKTEVRVEIDKARNGVIALGAGMAVAAIGAVLLGHMLVYLINDLLNLSMWVAYLIVGALFAIIGAVLLQRGVEQMKQIDPVPHETIESVRKDVEWIKEQNPSDKI